MLERIGGRVGDFVGTTARRAATAVEELVPGLEPPKKRRGMPNMKQAAAVAAAVAGVVSSLPDPRNRVLRRAKELAGTVAGLVPDNGKSAKRSASSAKSSAKSSARGSARSNGSNGRSNGNGRSSGRGLAAKTREELYELAKKADVPGRSQMSKDELVAALRK